jgi:ribonuclease HI
MITGGRAMSELEFTEHPDSKMTTDSVRPRVVIYADGSYKPAINFGGYGTLMSSEGHNLLIYGGSPGDSNNRMELTGVLSALRRLVIPCDVLIVSDSQYVVNGLNGYIWNWAVNDWKNAKGQPVANRDLWEEMLMYCQYHVITTQWVKGHAGHPENEQCDRLATMGAYAAASLPSPLDVKMEPEWQKQGYPGDNDIDEIVDYYIGK